MLSTQTTGSAAGHNWPHLLFSSYGLQENCDAENKSPDAVYQSQNSESFGTLYDNDSEDASPSPEEKDEVLLRKDAQDSSDCQSRRRLSQKRVSFPDDESKLVSHFIDPSYDLTKVGTTNQSLLTAYTSSCEKHNTEPIEKIVQQLENFDLGQDRAANLSLRGLDLNPRQCESLEEILRYVPLQLFDLGSANTDSEGLIALFDMVEFYEAATHVSIASNSLDLRGWQACSRMIKKTECLEWLDAAQVPLSEQSSALLGRALRANATLRVLHLDSCSLGGRPLSLLVNALKINRNLRELYLADNNLGCQDAVHLSILLRSNASLQCLDIKNNVVKDKGMNVICEAFLGDDGNKTLLSLVVWNNELTSECAPAIGKALAANSTLKTLNLGHNQVSDDGVMAIVNSGLANNRSLVNLGLQGNGISCVGAVVLAEAIAKGSALQRIDLRKNPIRSTGLEMLAASLKDCHQMNCIDLTTDSFTEDEEGQACRRFANEIALVCATRANEMKSKENDEKVDPVQAAVLPGSLRSSRKISLTCPIPAKEAKPSVQVTISEADDPNWDKPGEKKSDEKQRRLRSPLPSPLPSPQQSPSVGSRFRVSVVAESSPVTSSLSSTVSPSPRSRFTVTPVQEETQDSASVVRSSPAKVVVGFDVSQD